jgi:hypothetical protein
MMALTQEPSSFQEGRISFKDKVLGNRTPLSVKDSGHLLEWNLVRIEYDNGNRLLPRIHIDDGLFNDLCYPWHNSLIIKLLVSGDKQCPTICKWEYLISHLAHGGGHKRWA